MSIRHSFNKEAGCLNPSGCTETQSDDRMNERDGTEGKDELVSLTHACRKGHT